MRVSVKITDIAVLSRREFRPGKGNQLAEKGVLHDGQLAQHLGAVHLFHALAHLCPRLYARDVIQHGRMLTTGTHTHTYTKILGKEKYPSKGDTLLDGIDKRDTGKVHVVSGKGFHDLGVPDTLWTQVAVGH